jgi:hypothetical protein
LHLAANDIVFYFHHGYIDYMFMTWRKNNPQAQIPDVPLKGFQRFKSVSDVLSYQQLCIQVEGMGNYQPPSSAGMPNEPMSGLDAIHPQKGNLFVQKLMGLDLNQKNQGDRTPLSSTGDREEKNSKFDRIPDPLTNSTLPNDPNLTEIDPIPLSDMHDASSAVEQGGAPEAPGKNNALQGLMIGGITLTSVFCLAGCFILIRWYKLRRSPTRQTRFPS